jgi:Glyoxalase-like domain
MVDHLVYCVPELDAGTAGLERRLGVRAAGGGRHPGRGTHNALLGLGGGSYLEVIAPDPGQEPPAGPRSFGLDGLAEPRLVAWAVRVTAIEDAVERARRAGYDPGPIQDRSRARPDGVLLRWRLTDHPPAGPGFPVPFVIDWLDAPHPAGDAPGGATLLGLSAVHPEPDAVRQAVQALRVTVRVDRGPAPALVAELDTPKGRVVLR